MRPILSATETNNYKLANWLDDKLKPLSVNKFTITDPLMFAEELREQEIGEDDLLLSYDVSSLFTNVAVDETIRILVDKAFEREWFNTKCHLHLKRSELTTLLILAVKNQLFQLDGQLYEQVDGVMMGWVRQWVL